MLHYLRGAHPESQVPPWGVHGSAMKSGRNVSKPQRSCAGWAVGQEGHWPGTMGCGPHTRAFGRGSSPIVPTSCRTFPNKQGIGWLPLHVGVTWCPSHGTSEHRQWSDGLHSAQGAAKDPRGQGHCECAVGAAPCCLFLRKHKESRTQSSEVPGELHANSAKCHQFSSDCTGLVNKGTQSPHLALLGLTSPRHM